VSSVVKSNKKLQQAGSEGQGKHKSTGNRPDLSSQARRRSGKIFGRGLGGHQNSLIGDVWWERLVRDKEQLEAVRA
jgi:hypothetical protein